MAKYKVELDGCSNVIESPNEDFITCAKLGAVTGYFVRAGLKTGASIALLRSNVKSFWKLVGVSALGMSAKKDIKNAVIGLQLKVTEVTDDDEPEAEETLEEEPEDDLEMEEPLN